MGYLQALVDPCLCCCQPLCSFLGDRCQLPADLLSRHALLLSSFLAAFIQELRQGV